MDKFMVIENTPGYLPEDDGPATFEVYSEAVAYANELGDTLEEAGYTTDRAWASADNLYAICATNADLIHDLGRFIEIVRVDNG